MGRIPKKTLTLEQFILRQQVISLYRDFMRVTRHLPEADRQETRKWIRDDFKQNMHLQDEIDIKMHLSRGRLSLREVSTAVHQAK
ncbi:LYR motif-containing protein 2-like [Clytia hemisphaerica]|uniref:LYR motif-containing protein 2-like n=1 Tax=Clytia hemisphaerica TaxID=252671 RepID=UPI0034D3CD3B